MRGFVVRRSLGLVGMAILMLPLSGCMGLMESAYESASPTWEQARSKFPVLPSGYGRAVFMYPGKTTGERMVGVWIGGFAVVPHSIDGVRSKELMDGQFYIKDLPNGRHVLSMSSFFGPTYRFPFEVTAGSTIYLLYDPPKREWEIIDQASAVHLLQTLHEFM